MKIVMLITAFEMAAFTVWMIYKYYGGHKQMMLAMSATRSHVS